MAKRFRLSDTAKSLELYFNNVFVRQDDNFNVKNYGAVGDGTTNDTVAIQAAITAAGTDGTVIFPSGNTFLIDLDEIVIACNVYGTGAILKVTETGAGFALHLGDDGDSVHDKTMILPEVHYLGTGAGSSWQTGSVGVKVSGLADSYIFVNRILQFEKGLHVTSLDSTTYTSYNTYQLLRLHSNKIGVKIDGGASNGFANESVYIGGHILVGSAYGSNITDCHAIKIEKTGTYRPSQNRFYGPCVEGNRYEDYKTIYCSGWYNMFHWPRFENDNPGIIYPNSDSNKNYVQTPYLITITDSGSNNVYDWIQTEADEITATSEGVAASLTTKSTQVTTNGDTDLDNVTLANGTAGQRKAIFCTVEGNAADTWKITPATMCGGTQITFAGVGEGCIMEYADSEGWVVIGNNGGTIA